MTRPQAGGSPGRPLGAGPVLQDRVQWDPGLVPVPALSSPVWGTLGEPSDRPGLGEDAGRIHAGGHTAQHRPGGFNSRHGLLMVLQVQDQGAVRADGW